MNWDSKKALGVAKNAAYQGGNYLKENFSLKPKVEYKGEINLLTERDLKSQEIVSKIIQNAFPDHSILGEESLSLERDKEFLWVIDPLDGTTNYAHSLPIFSVSVALLVGGQAQVGVVYSPMLGEMFWALRGEGAYLNEDRITVSGEVDLNKSLLATGFPYDLRDSSVNNVDYFNTFIFKSQAVRRCGSAALDLAYTAAGRFDGFWELKLHPWDTAAGALLVEEAGGMITDFSGLPFDPFHGECLASNGIIHTQMREIIENVNKERKSRG